MGQMTYALMYGIEVQEGMVLRDEDSDESHGLLDLWERECAGEIKAWEKRHPRKSYRDPSGDSVYVPDHPYEGLDIIGFYVAVGASGEAGVPDLGGCALSEAKAHYAAAYKAARRRWRRFAKWCEAGGMTLPKARLYLTETEVA